MRSKNVAAKDCDAESQKFSKTIDQLKSMIDIKKKVIQDYIAIRDKFPCHTEIHFDVSYLVCKFFFVVLGKQFIK